MGVVDQLQERDADAQQGSGGDESKRTVARPSTLAGAHDPFLQSYRTEPYDLDQRTVSEILTALVAVGNLTG